MKKLILLATLLATSMSAALAADIKISQLPLGSAATAGINDSFPYVQATTNITKRLTLWDMINLPPMVSTYAPKANPTFTGTVTAPTFVGALTGNASTATALAANPTDCASNTFANAIVANGNLTCAAVGDAALSTSYLKADGTRALTGNWAAGAFSATHNSVAVGSSANTISGLTTLVNGSGSVVMNSTGAMTVPGATDTFVGKATTDTLTNKTISGASNTISALAASTITSGTLATARGGTNLDTSASTGVAKVASGTWSVATIVNADISASAAIASSKISFTSPTVQKFTSGSGTYTKPANVLYIRVRMVGGGGGGSGSGTGSTGRDGGNGGDTTFGSSFLTAGGGVGSLTSGPPAGGGTCTVNSPAIGASWPGGTGSPGGTGGTATQMPGGIGGNSIFGGGGGGGWGGFGAAAGATNTGAGGGGGGATNTAGVFNGQGGGAGCGIDVIVPSPSSSYSYSVGASGTAGVAGTSGFVAGAGALGFIEVTEYYQ